MSEGLFKKIGAFNDFLKSQSWLTKPIYYMVDHVVPTESRDNLDWNEESDLAILEQAPLRARKLLYCILAILATALVWAWFAKVDEVTRGEGRVIPSRQVQVIQSLDGGIVSEILVREGDIVKVGMPLIKIDETRAISSLRENQGQYLALLAKQARLKALAEDSAFSLPAEVKKNSPQVYEQEYALYNTSREELASIVSIARDQMVQREKELDEVKFKKEIAEKTYDSANKELVLASFAQQANEQKSIENMDFHSAYMADRAAVSEQPLLVVDCTLVAPKDKAAYFSMQCANTQMVKIALNHELIFAMTNMLQLSTREAGWDLKMEDTQPETIQHMTQQVLH